MKRFLIILIFIIIIKFCFYSCSTKLEKDNIIKIQGSDTMYMLVLELASEYMKINPGISISVSGGGTGAGVDGLIDDNIDICLASRNLTAEEISNIAQKHNTIGIAHLIAKDGLSFYVHPDNEVDNLNYDELRDILHGKINNWKQLGWLDTAIIPVIRPPNSGTHHYVRLYILEEDEYCVNCIVLPTTPQILDTISINKQLIGYGGIGYKTNAKALKINGVEPSVKNIQDDIYPISRYLYFYTLRQPSRNVNRFISWVLSNEGQKIIENMNYIPLWKIE